MLASKLYAPTLRETPADADVVSQQYMLRAGMIRKMAGGDLLLFTISMEEHS